MAPIINPQVINIEHNANPTLVVVDRKQGIKCMTRKAVTIAGLENRRLSRYDSNTGGCE